MRQDIYVQVQASYYKRRRLRLEFLLPMRWTLGVERQSLERGVYRGGQLCRVSDKVSFRHQTQNLCRQPEREHWTFGLPLSCEGKWHLGQGNKRSPCFKFLAAWKKHWMVEKCPQLWFTLLSVIITKLLYLIKYIYSRLP